MTTTLGYGTTPYGIGPYGTSVSVMSLAFASASSIRRVRVRLTSPPRAVKESVLGDALNPHSWSVARLDTGASLFVLQVEKLSSITFDLYLMQKIGDYPIQHEVSAELLFSVFGSQITSPVTATFLGVTWPLSTAPELLQTQDLKYNEPGVFEVGASGDYLNISDLEVLRKVLLRKLTTLPASFFHLPNFGIGLPVKEPLPNTSLVKLKRQIELAALEEPEVAQAGVEVSFSNEGILIIKLMVRTRSGQDLDVISSQQTNFSLTL